MIGRALYTIVNTIVGWLPRSWQQQLKVPPDENA